MKAVVKRVGLPACIEEVENKLESLWEIVGGYIEVVRLSYDTKVLMIVNEEGKFTRQPNIVYHELNDVIYGDVLVVGQKGDDFASLTNVQAAQAILWLDMRSIN